MGSRNMEYANGINYITVWAPATDPVTNDPLSDGDGNPILSDPYQLCVRWEETNRLYVTSKAEKVGLSAIIDNLTEEIPFNSQVWKGALADLPDNPSPLLKVIDKTNIPDVRGRCTQRTAFLVRI